MHTRIVPLAALFAVFVAYANPAAAQFYAQHNLVSDGAVSADLVDPSLVNAWGLVSSPTSPWWVSDNGTGVATLYNASKPQIAKVGLTVTIPGGAPTGVVFNGGAGFVVSGAGSGPARFIFASETGTISGWNPAAAATQAIVEVPASSAVYKGLALANAANGDFLYATNFHEGTVDVFDSAFHRVDLPGAFTDNDLPAGYAPFGIRNIGGVLFVTYALQDADRHDDVPGMGHGFVDAYDTSGKLLARIASRGTLDSPWGLALAPDSFGTFGGDLLIGNFGDGRIHAYDLQHSRGNGEAIFRGMLHAANGQPLQIDGLWALSFGNGAAAGPKDRLFFTAGPNGEADGLFGMLEPAPAPGR